VHARALSLSPSLSLSLTHTHTHTHKAQMHAHALRLACRCTVCTVKNTVNISYVVLWIILKGQMFINRVKQVCGDLCLLALKWSTPCSGCMKWELSVSEEKNCTRININSLSLQKLQFYFLLLQSWAAECEVFHLLQLHMSTLQASSNTKHVRSSGQDEFRFQILKPLYVKRDSKQPCDQTGAVYVC